MPKKSRSRAFERATDDVHTLLQKVAQKANLLLLCIKFKFNRIKSDK